MSFFVAAATVGGGSAILGTALIGAGVGGAYSALTGDGDILNSMLTGGIIGLGVGGIGTAAGLTPAVTAPGTLAGAGASTVTVPTANVAMGTAPALTGTVAPVTAAGAAAPLTLTSGAAPVVSGVGTVTSGVAPTATGLTGGQMLGYGLAGTAAMQLLGDKKQTGVANQADPGMVRPYEYSSKLNEPTGNYPSPYPTVSYDKAGNPIMDTREVNYFTQDFAALKPYSAKTGTVNPNIPLPSSVNAARGGIMGNYDDEIGNDDVGLNQGNMQKGIFGLGYAHGGVARFADKGMVDEEAELRKTVMNNLKKLNPEQIKNVMGSFQGEGELQKQFLMKSMPNYASSMAPSISSMVEGAQYGDRMAQAYGGQPRNINVIPTNVDPERGFFGGIAQIGQNIDPQTRVNAMADIERTPYDRTVSDSVRKVGVGLDRQIGRDSNLSAFYEQDPMGRNKMGGARLTQRFDNGGSVLLQGGPLQNQRFEQGGFVQNYGFGGLTLIEDMIRQAEQGQQAQIPKYNFDQNTQRYSVADQPMMGTPSFGGYSFNPNTDRYSTNPQPMAAGGMTSLGDYSDGGRLLKGPGDGVSDSIPATIADKQPARLADGEFVIPARIVSEIGNGSTDAGAKRLYAMMDRIQDGRKKTIGKKNVAKDTKAKKHLLA